MIENLCENCSYNGSTFELCGSHRKNFSKKFNKQYDEFYKDCRTWLQIEPCVVPLGSNGMPPPTLNVLGHDISEYSKARSDIPAPEFFSKNIGQLKEYMLQPKEIKHMLDCLRRPEYALASYEFDKTFLTQFSGFSIENFVKPKFTEEYDMDILRQILELLPKVKKIKRIE